jgi:hypothetical protein
MLKCLFSCNIFNLRKRHLQGIIREGERGRERGREGKRGREREREGERGREREREGERGREREREGEREKKRLGKFGFLAVFRTCLHFQGPFKRGRE